MSTSLVKAPHITIDEHKLFFIRVDGECWIALKPICDALGVNWNRQFQNLQDDPILGSAFANQQMQVSGNQGRKMVCLPERFIYGWLLQIRSKNAQLIAFQRKCYLVLFDHFHGGARNIREYARQLAELEVNERRLLQKAKQDPLLAQLEDTRKQQRRLRRSFSGTMNAAVREQMDMMFLD